METIIFFFFFQRLFLKIIYFYVKKKWNYSKQVSLQGRESIEKLFSNLADYL